VDERDLFFVRFDETGFGVGAVGLDVEFKYAMKADGGC
jgi:hypothetical protein